MTTMTKPKTAASVAAKSRLLELSVLNVFFCLLVVFIHVSADPLTRLTLGSWQYILVMLPRRLASFVVQGFILLSGVKMFLNKTDVSYRAHLKRTARIAVTYIVWVLVYFAYFTVSDNFTVNLRELPRHILTGDLVAHFYFIIIIVQFYLLTPVWARLIKRGSPVLLIPLALILSVIFGQHLPNMLELTFGISDFAYSDRVFAKYLIYWIAGCCIGANYGAFKRQLRRSLKPAAAAFVISAAINAALCCLHYVGGRSIPWFESFIVIYHFSAILFFFALACRFADRQPRIKSSRVTSIVQSLDKVTFGVYLSHILVMFIVGDVLALFQGVSIGVSYSVRMVFTYIITLGGALALRTAKLAARARFFSRAR